MARIENTVFISYRRTDVYTALAVYENLKNQGYDVFFDYRSISSGDFEQIITSNIRARAHFLLILTATALDRCNEPGDWLRREIEIAIDEKRNIVPLVFKGFQFGAPSVAEKLTGKLKNLSRYNGLNVHEDYFDEAMHRLRTQYLNIPLDTVLHPVSTEVQKVVRAEQVAADKALEQIEDVKELVKQAEEKPAQKKEFPKPVAAQAVKSETASSVSTVPWRTVAGLAGGLLLIALLIWGGANLLRNRSLANLATATNTPPPVSTPTPPETSTLPTPTLDIGSTMTGEDGMILFYVPASEFTMGSEDGNDDEKPAHKVELDAFWIDQTEVTNKMYALCVDAGVCEEPTNKSSYTNSTYYGNAEFDNYPVIYVNWNMAKMYCEWVDRRLPTEAEWEKAGRGIDANIYPWGDTFDGSLVNFCDTNCSFGWANKSFDDGFADVSPVGNYPAGQSVYGTLDMAGNVWEWVNDRYDVYPGGDPNASSDFGQTYRVLRGGSWSDLDSGVRSARRYGLDPTLTGNDLGFRCSRSP
jgi:serine/threonine-protein kinase